MTQQPGSPGQGLASAIALTRKAITVGDTWTDPRVARHITDPQGIRSMLQVPITAGDEVFGVFGINCRERRTITDHDDRLLVALAQRAALTVENAHLFEQAQGKAALEERQRLARELHDSVSQALFSIALGARTARTLLDRDPTKAASPLDYVLNLPEAGLAEMRALIFELRPESLATEGRWPRWRSRRRPLKARHTIETELSPCSEPDASLAVKEALCRIAQEALQTW